MFDKYLIGEDSLRNIRDEAGAITGFAFDARLGYYRGLGLTMVEELVVSVDGQDAPREAVRLHHEEGPLTLDQMETAGEKRWEFAESLTISVDRPGGLTGTSEIGLTEKLRISYLPFLLQAADRKQMKIR